MGKEETADLKPLKAMAKRPTKKKPKDKPKRPLSAYNFFFKEEREKILKVVLADEGAKVDNDPDSEDYISDEQLAKLKKDGGKISFEFMGKLIGQRWKNIDPDRLTKFSELAAEDTERYKKEMVTYNSRQEAKMRNEALKPPASYGGRDMGKGDRSGGYSDMSMNFGGGMGSGGYPYGMDFSGYGMPMGMYGGYGGYPGMGGGGMGSGGMGGGGGTPEAMARGMNSSQMQEAAQQYGGMGMYGMMGGGFQGGMMGYGGGQGQGGGYDQQGPSQQGMDPQGQGQGGMYPGGGYGGQGWGQH